MYIYFKDFVKKSSFLLLIISSISLIAQFSRMKEELLQPYSEHYQRVSAGNNHYLEIKNGKLYAAGYNNKGQLGIGNTDNVSTPVQVGDSDNWVTIAAGEEFSLAIKADGTLWAWGNNDRGQLGIGTTNNSLVPTQVESDNKWISVSAGGKHAIALKNDGSLWTWGYNYFGQLGNGTVSGWSAASPTPTKVGNDTNWTSISAGTNHNLALKSNGTLWSWGENTLGQVGDGNAQANPKVSTPYQVGQDTWRVLSAGGLFSTAIKTDGTLWAWGNNYYGEMGNGGTDALHIPTQVGTDIWKNVEAGRYHATASKTDGSVWVWGDETSKGIKQGSAPTKKERLSGIVQVSSGEGFTLALKSDGKLYSWGKNNYGQLGTGTTSTNARPEALYNGSKSNEVINVASSHGFNVMVLYSNGTLKGWGDNGDYNLGLGTNSDTEPLPVAVPLAGSNNISVSTGSWHTMALKDNGTVWGWGDAEAVGSGSSQSYETVPVQINSDNDWISVISGAYTTAGIKSDGSLWMWGSNSYGELGLGNTVSNAIPTKIGTDSDRWKSVSPGGFHTIAIKADGTLWGWGRNYTGEAVGGTSTAAVLAPQQIGTDSDWIAVSAHTSSSTALKSDGTLWGWGANSWGQLGQTQPAPNKLIVPTRIGTPEERFLKSKLASWSGAAIFETGELKAWSNFATYFNELGTGDGQNHPTPFLVPNQKDVIQISAGQNHKSVLKAQRLDVCMVGRNYSGEIGVGTNEPSYSTYQCGVAPVEVENETEISVTLATFNNSPAVIASIGETLQLNAEVLPVSISQEVVWSVEQGNNVVTVDENGLVTSLKNGQAIVRATSVENSTKFADIEITVQQLGTNDINAAATKIYPNPTKDILHISSSKIVKLLEVYNLAGQKVAQKEVQSIDLSKLQKGIYLIKITFKDYGVETYKVIKE